MTKYLSVVHTFCTYQTLPFAAKCVCISFPCFVFMVYLPDTLVVILTFKDDPPESRLKNGSFSPQDGSPHGTAA